MPMLNFFLLTMNPFCMQLVRTWASCVYASLNVFGMPRTSSVDFSILSARPKHVILRPVNWYEENTDYWKSSIDASSYWRLHSAAYEQDQLEIISPYCEYDGFHTNFVVFAKHVLSRYYLLSMSY